MIDSVLEDREIEKGNNEIRFIGNFEKTRIYHILCDKFHCNIQHRRGFKIRFKRRKTLIKVCSNELRKNLITCDPRVKLCSNLVSSEERKG